MLVTFNPGDTELTGGLSLLDAMSGPELKTRDVFPKGIPVGRNS